MSSRGLDRAAEVAVVGAGAIGLAVACQLRAAGIGPVLVVDANPSPGLGSSSRANGGVRAQFTTPINIEFSRYTIRALAELDARTAGLVGFRPVGYLFMSGTEAGAGELRRGYELQRSLGLDVEWLSPQQVGEMVPFVERAGLRAVTCCSSDGLIDPHGVVSALWSEGRRLGVNYLFDTQVLALERRGETTLVRGSRVDIEATHVVNAAGPFAADLAALAGIDLPVLPYRRNLACTEPVPGYPTAVPMCVDMDTGVLIRREPSGGFVIAYSDPGDQPSRETSFDPGFLEAVASRIGNRFPFLESVGIDQRKCWAGLYPETPDHHAIVDRSDGAPWFVQCAGFGGHGIMHSLAAGLAVAELIRDGRCTSFDITPLRADRFGGDLQVETAVL
ncbi:MAG TPA: FAD-dependent oxidoreductase [Candidatus Binatia bacterium]|nr:FAD-dependent oxidoreductase [Candidatus Binatia bacterium]